MGLPCNTWSQKGTTMTPVSLWKFFPRRACKSSPTYLKQRKKLAMLWEDRVEGIVPSEGGRRGLSPQSCHPLIKLGQPCDLTGTLVPFFVKYSQVGFLTGLFVACVHGIGKECSREPGTEQAATEGPLPLLDGAFVYLLPKGWVTAIHCSVLR